MAHIHSVYDTDNHFKIDAVSRQITCEATAKTTIMQYDHNSERFTFEIPRYIDGHDMSLCNRVDVHYINVAADKSLSNPGIYQVDDLQVSPEDNNVVICSWLISQNATQLVGSLNFCVRFACVSKSDVLDYIWNTAIYSNIFISNGLYNADIIVEQYADILESWRLSIEQLESSVKDMTHMFYTIAVPSATDDLGAWFLDHDLYTRKVVKDWITEDLFVSVCCAANEIFTEHGLSITLDNGFMEICLTSLPENACTLELVVVNTVNGGAL